MEILDGLRGLAAVGVIALHTKVEVPFYHFAFYRPDFFFVVSGFVLAKYFDSANVSTSFREFAIRRAVRIFPLATIVLVALLVFTAANLSFGSIGSWPAGYSIRSIAAAAGLLHVFYTPALSVTGPFWSLSAELFANLAFFGVTRKFGTKAVWLLISLSAAAEGFAIFLQPEMNPGYGITGLMAIARGMLGFGLGLLVAESKPWNLSLTKVLGLATLTISFVALPQSPLSYLIAPGIFATWVMIIRQARTSFIGPKFSKVLRYSGNSSFGIFAWHVAFMPIAYTLATSLQTLIPVNLTTLHFWIVLSLSLAAARVTLRYVEAPSVRWVKARL